MTLIYLACPYTHPDHKVEEFRHAVATYVAFTLIRDNKLVYSPLTHNIPLDRLGIDGSWESWKRFDSEMVARTDRMIVIMLPGWQESRGVAAEVALAEELGHPIEWLEVTDEMVEKAKELISSQVVVC